MSQYVDFDYVDENLVVMRMHNNNDAKRTLSVYERVKLFHSIALSDSNTVLRGEGLINKRVASDFIAYGLTFIVKMDMNHARDAIIQAIKAYPVCIFKPKVIDEITDYYPYRVKDGYRPDMVSNEVYGGPAFAYLILMFNDVYDPVFDWPLGSRQFENYIINKYGSIDSALTTVKYYYQIIMSTSTFHWSCKHTWKRSAKNTMWCVIGCSIGDFGTILFFQLTQIPFPILAIMSLAIINGLITSIILETIILIKQGFSFNGALKTASGMSLISMLSMEIMMNLTDYLLTGGAILTWWVVPIMLIVGFLTPWPYNYWRLKKFGINCH